MNNDENSLSKFKSKEEYYFVLQERLLSQIQHDFRAINSHFYFVYLLVAFLILYSTNSIKNVNVLGATLDFTSKNVLLYIMFLILISYGFIWYYTAKLIQIMETAVFYNKKICNENKQAVKLKASQLLLFGNGFLGFITSVTQQILHLEKKRKVLDQLSIVIKPYSSGIKYTDSFVFTLKFIFWIISVSIELAFILCLAFGPIGIMVYYDFTEPTFQFSFTISKFFISCTLLMSIINGYKMYKLICVGLVDEIREFMLIIALSIYRFLLNIFYRSLDQVLNEKNNDPLFKPLSDVERKSQKELLKKIVSEKITIVKNIRTNQYEMMMSDKWKELSDSKNCELYKKVNFD